MISEALRSYLDKVVISQSEATINLMPHHNCANDYISAQISARDSYLTLMPSPGHTYIMYAV